jgi:hypothetical protein
MWVWPLSALVWNDKVGQCFMLKFCGVIIVPIPTNCLQKRIWQQVDMDQTCRNWIPVRGLNSMPQMIRTRKNCCFRSESKVDPFRRRWFLQFPPKKKTKMAPPSGRMSVSSENPTCMMACLGFPFTLLRRVTTQYGTPKAFMAEAQTMQCPAQLA